MTGIGAAFRRQDGFTLVETIVAFAILALVIGVAVEIIGNGSVRQRFDSKRMIALSHAQSELAALTGTGAVSPGIKAGLYDDGNAWRIQAVPLAKTISTPEGVPAALPYAVTVEIYSPGSSEATVTLKTVVVGIAPSQS